MNEQKQKKLDFLKARTGIACGEGDPDAMILVVSVWGGPGTAKLQGDQFFQRVLEEVGFKKERLFNLTLYGQPRTHLSAWTNLVDSYMFVVRPQYVLVLGEILGNLLSRVPRDLPMEGLRREDWLYYNEKTNLEVPLKVTHALQDVIQDSKTSEYDRFWEVVQDVQRTLTLAANQTQTTSDFTEVREPTSEDLTEA